MSGPPGVPTRTDGVTHPHSDEGRPHLRRRRATYVVTAVLLGGLVASAVVDQLTEVDVWGVSTDRRAAAGGGYELEVRYPTVTRPGLGTPLAFTVTATAGTFDGPVTVAVDAGWVELLDLNSVLPEPGGWTRDTERLVLTFDPPDGGVLDVSLDARAEPALQPGTGGSVAVLDPSGATAVEVAFSTVVLP